MRIRSLKPEFFKDRVTGRWPSDLKMFYAGLWVFADDEGRFEWEPDLIRCELYPYDRDTEIDLLLERVRSTGRVIRYVVDGRAYGLVVKFKEHQHPDKPKTSKLPAPSEGSTDLALVPDPSPTPPRSVTAGREGKGEERREACAELAPPPAAPPPAPEVASPVVAVLPCVGKGPKHFTVTEAHVAGWRGAYPGVDVLSQVRQARAWLEANPRKRKTAEGVPRFLVNWLNRAQNDPRNKAPEEDQHDVTFRRLRDQAERELAGPGGSGGIGPREAEEGSPTPREVPEDGAAMSAAARELLGTGGAAGLFQDSGALEHGAQLRGE